MATPTVFVRKVRRFPFTGSIAAATKGVIGPSGGTGVTLEVPGLLTTDIPVAWEILAHPGALAASLDVRPGPSTASFTAAAGAVLSNFATLPPGISYSYYYRLDGQQIDFADLQMPVLLVQGNGGTANFSGWVTVWRQ